ncbi:MAG: hypothetical protein ACHQZR_07765 [Candidatus Limnocylindrales bacterium]
MTIAYLDPDDEITSAVARLRASDDVRVALVLPPGSRIATSRINFRLLAHEAREHQRRLAVVAGEAGVRAVAVSAGLPAYATVAEYEAALADARLEPEAAAGPAAAAVAAKPARKGKRAATAESVPTAAAATVVAAGAAASTVAVEPALPTTAVQRGGGGTDLPVVPVRERAGAGGHRGFWVLLSAVLLVALIGAGAWVAFNVLPTATITVTPRTEVVGPISMTVTADPNAATVDPVAGVVPAQSVTVPLSATNTFNATGTKSVDTAATGTVTFINYDPGGAHTVQQGTAVSTQPGVVFQTGKAVTVPRAVISGSLKIIPGNANVGITAVVSGTAGNVGAGTITKAPGVIEAALGVGSGRSVVTNTAPTTGGTHTVTQVVQTSDYTSAVASLSTVLKTQLDAAARDPATAPAGVTLIPATATVGPVTADQPASAIVGKEQPSFQLTLTATGTVDGVDTTQVAQVAAARLATSVPSGHMLFPSSVQTQVGPAVVTGGAIKFSASASGQMTMTLDPVALVQQVRGKSVAEARSILQTSGVVTIETWPFYVSGVPDDPSRVTVTVVVPQAPVGASPGASTSAPPKASPTTAPQPSGT